MGTDWESWNIFINCEEDMEILTDEEEYFLVVEDEVSLFVLFRFVIYTISFKLVVGKSTKRRSQLDSCHERARQFF